jgi:hypothetical protein
LILHSGGVLAKAVADVPSEHSLPYVDAACNEFTSGASSKAAAFIPAVSREFCTPYRAPASAAEETSRLIYQALPKSTAPASKRVKTGRINAHSIRLDPRSDLPNFSKWQAGLRPVS